MELKERVVNIISDATKTEIAKISEATRFVDDLNLDSLDMVEMMMKMEDEFNIEIPESDAESLRTVKDVIEYLGTKQ